MRWTGLGPPAAGLPGPAGLRDAVKARSVRCAVTCAVSELPGPRPREVIEPPLRLTGAGAGRVLLLGLQQLPEDEN